MSRSPRADYVRFLAREEVERRQQAAVEGRPRAELVVAEGEGPPILRLYDVIDDWGGWWGISAAEVAAALDDLADRPEVHVHVNSPGGIATEGVAIANLLRQFPGKVVAIVDGLAASAASMVLTGATQVVMAPSSQMMIHEASSGAWGPADYLRQQADSLDHLSDRYAEAYARKAGGEAAAWRELMKAETWYSPDEAVDAGLADTVLDEKETTSDPAATAQHDLRAFAYAGRKQAPAPKTPAAPSASGSTTTALEADMSQISDALRERLGIADENADEGTILAAVDDLLEQATAPPAAPTVSITPPDGTVLVDAAQFAALQAAAEEGRQARAQQLADQRAALVTAAVADGRLAPAQRDAWLAKLAAEGDSGETVLASLAKGLVPVASSLGHAGEPDLADDEAIYAELYGTDTKVGG